MAANVKLSALEKITTYEKESQNKQKVFSPLMNDISFRSLSLVFTSIVRQLKDARILPKQDHRKQVLDTVFTSIALNPRGPSHGLL